MVPMDFIFFGAGEWRLAVPWVVTLAAPLCPASLGPALCRAKPSGGAAGVRRSAREPQAGECSQCGKGTLIAQQRPLPTNRRIPRLQSPAVHFSRNWGKGFKKAWSAVTLTRFGENKRQAELLLTSVPFPSWPLAGPAKEGMSGKEASGLCCPRPILPGRPPLRVSAVGGMRVCRFKTPAQGGCVGRTCPSLNPSQRPGHHRRQQEEDGLSKSCVPV